MTNQKVAIVVNGSYLNAVGLKTLILEENPSLIVRLLNSEIEQKGQEYSITFSFRPLPDTILVSDDTNEQDIRKLLHKTLSKFKQEPKTAANEKKALSQREIEVLRLVASGLINKEIAERLHISLQTVLTHRKHISEKLEIRTTAGFTAYAMLNGLV